MDWLCEGSANQVVSCAKGGKEPEGLMANLEEKLVEVLAPTPFFHMENQCFLDFTLDVLPLLLPRLSC